MKRGMSVTMKRGAFSLTGVVLAVTDDQMVIQKQPGLTVTLRCDPASTTPSQWRCAGLPVEVQATPDLTDFRKRLWDLERRT